MPREAGTTEYNASHYRISVFHDLGVTDVEVMPPHANRRVTVPGPRLYFRDRTHDGCTCRDGIRDAVADLVQRTGVDEFTTGQVAEEMMAAGTS